MLRCRSVTCRMRRSFGAGWLIWVRSGRLPEALSREFEPTAPAITNWVRQAERDAGGREDGLAAAARAEPSRLRRENRQLRQARAIPANAAAWLTRKTGTVSSPGLPVHDGVSGRIPDRHHGPRAGCLEGRPSRLEEAGVAGKRACGRPWDRSATRMPTPGAKAASRHARARSGTAPVQRRQTPEWPSSAASQAGIIRPGGIPGSATGHRLLSRRR